VKLGHGQFGKNGDLGYDWKGRNTIIVDGKKSLHGLSMHPIANAFSSVKYRLGSKGGNLLASAALNDTAEWPVGNQMGSRTPLTFIVIGDGKVLWRSKPVQLCGQTEDCKVSVAGVDILELRIECPGEQTHAQAVWMEPRIIQGEVDPTTQPRSTTIVFRSVKDLSSLGASKNEGEWTVQDGRLSGAAGSIFWFNGTFSGPFTARMAIVMNQGIAQSLTFAPEVTYRAGEYWHLSAADGFLHLGLGANELAPRVKLLPGRHVIEAWVGSEEVRVLADDREVMLYRFQKDISPPRRVGLSTATGKLAVESVSLTALTAEKVQYLSDMIAFDVKMGPWSLGRGNLGNPGASPIIVNGKKADKGLGMHAESRDYVRAKYKLAKTATAFKASVAINDPSPASGGGSPLFFQVYGDGKLLWSSTGINVPKQTQSCSVSVKNVDILELRITCPRDGEHAHAVWVDPYIIK
jgi:hypothetical protein